MAVRPTIRCEYEKLALNSHTGSDNSYQMLVRDFPLPSATTIISQNLFSFKITFQNFQKIIVDEFILSHIFRIIQYPSPRPPNSP